MGRRKRQLEANDEYARLVASRRVSELLVDLYLRQLDAFHYTRELENQTAWDDLEITRQKGSRKQIELYQIKKQNTPLRQETFNELLSDANKLKNDNTRLFFIIPTWIPVSGISGLLPLRKLCKQSSSNSVVPKLVYQNASQAEEQWLNHIQNLCDLNDTQTIQLLGSMQIRTRHEDDLTSDIERNLAKVLNQQKLDDPRRWLLEKIFELSDIDRQSGQSTLNALLDRFTEAQSSLTTPTSTPTEVSNAIESKNSSFIHAHGDFQLTSAGHIDRKETATIINFGKQTPSNTSVLLVTGDAGSGKSGALISAFKTLDNDEETTVLGFNADTIDTKSSIFTPFQHQGLDVSPLQALSTLIKNGYSNQAVLFFDQLDQLSELSGETAQKIRLFSHVRELLFQASSRPNIKVVAACRKVDLQSDSRFQQLEKKSFVNIQPLSDLDESEVREVLSEMGYNNVSEHHANFLKYPIRLRLLDEVTKGSGPSTLPSDEWELLRRFWRTKEKAARRATAFDGSFFRSTVCKISSRLQKSATAFVHRDSLSTRAQKLDWLNTENVIHQQASNEIGFFHSRFADFAFARCFSDDLTTWLAENHQYLERRSQVRAIMRELRSRAKTTDGRDTEYATTLESILDSDGKVRAHIQYSVASFLSNVPEMMSSEFELTLNLANGDDRFLRSQAYRILKLNFSAFKRTDESGMLNAWLPTCHPEKKPPLVKEAIAPESVPDDTLVSVIRSGVEAEPERAAIYLSELLQQRKKKASAIFRGVFSRNKTIFSDSEVFEVLLKSVRKGLWDDDMSAFSLLHADKAQFLRALRLFSTLLERNLQLVEQSTVDYTDYSDVKAASQKLFDHGFRADLLQKIRKSHPQEFTSHLFPILVQITEHFTVDHKTKIWRHFVNSAHLNDEEAFRKTMITVVEEQARQIFEDHSDELSRLRQLDTQVSNSFFYRICAGYATELADHGIEKLRRKIENRESLSLADGYVSLTRFLSNAHSTLPQARWATVLDTITNHFPSHEFTYKPDFGTPVGREQFRVLANLPETSLTESAHKRLLEFRRKFGERDPDARTVKAKSGVVDETDDIDFEILTDAEWMSYIRHADPSAEDHFHDPKVDRTLQRAAEKRPVRFLNLLAHRFDAAIPAEIYNAVLLGTNSSDSLENVEPGLIFDAVEKSYAVAKYATAKEVSWLIRETQTKPPKNVQNLLFDLMLNHPDPSEDTWKQGYQNADIHVAGLNTVRGSIADTISTFLNNSPEILEDYKNEIEKGVRDPSLQVRSCVASILLMALNHDREFAVQQFDELLTNSPIELFQTPPVVRFLKNAVASHPDYVKTKINRVLNSSHDSVRKSAGELLMGLTFSSPDYLDDLRTFTENEQADESILRGIAQTGFSNFHELSHAQKKALLPVLNCTHPEIHELVMQIARNLPDDVYEHDSTFLFKMGESKALTTAPSHLLHKLDQIDRPLHETSLNIAERLVSYLTSNEVEPGSELDADSRRLMDVLLRLYRDNEDDPELLERVLDSIDSLVRIGALSATRRLEKAHNDPGF